MTAEPRQPAGPDHELNERVTEAFGDASQLFFQLFRQGNKSIADCEKEALERALEKFPALNETEKAELAQTVNGLARIAMMTKYAKRTTFGRNGEIIPNPPEKEGGGRGM